MKDMTVHLIDDDDDLRESVKVFLEQEGFKTQAYASAIQFLQGLSKEDSGCIVTDVRMPGMSGEQLLETLAERKVFIPVIVITGHADVPLAVRAMKLGAVDLLEKPFRADDLIRAIRRALEFQSGRESDPQIGEIRARLSTLSPREHDVLQKLVQGLPNKVIAHEMGISPRTVEVHRANLMKKTSAGSLSELLRMVLSLERR